MQIHLTIGEFELLKQIVEDEKRLSCCATPALPQVAAQRRFQDELKIGRDLVGKELSRNLRLGFDELEDLADSLNWRPETADQGNQLRGRTRGEKWPGMPVVDSGAPSGKSDRGTRSGLTEWPPRCSGHSVEESGDDDAAPHAPNLGCGLA